MSTARSCRAPVVDEDDWTPPAPTEDAGPDQPALPGEQVLLDHDALAEGHDFYSVGGVTVSPDGTLLAYATDTVGDERYVLEVKDLGTGELLPRPDRGRARRRGVEPRRSRPVLLHRRRGLAPRQGVASPARLQRARRAGLPRDRRALLGRDRAEPHPAVPGHRLSVEEHHREPVPRLHDPEADWVVFHPREEGLQYGLEHAVIAGEDLFLVQHNHTGADFEIGTCPIAATPPSGGDR